MRVRRMRWGGWLLWIMGLGLAAGGCSDDASQSRSGGAAGSPAVASANIGAGGGTLTSLDGKARLTIPPGALANRETITIRSIHPAALPPEFAGADAAWDLGPEGLTLSAPVQLSVTLPEPPRQTDGSLRVPLSSLLTLAGATAEALGNPALTVEGDRATMAGTLTHLSPVALSSTLRGASFQSAGRIRVELIPLPEKLTVGQPYRADLQMSVDRLEEAGPVTERLLYRDQSEAPLRHTPLGEPTAAGFTELPVPSPLPISGSFALGEYGSYVCEAAADTARFSVVFNVRLFIGGETASPDTRLSFNTTHTCQAPAPPPTQEERLFLTPLFQPEALFELSIPEPFLPLFGLERNPPYAAVGHHSGMSIIHLNTGRVVRTKELGPEAAGPLQGAVAHLYNGKGCLFGYGERRYRACWDPDGNAFGPTEISNDGPYHDAGLISKTPTHSPSGARQLLWFVEADTVYQENQPGGSGSLIFERKLERGWFATGGTPTGTSKSAYFTGNGAQVLVVRGGPSEPGQLWWGNPAEIAGGRFVGSLGNDTRKIRCKIPICAVSHFGGPVMIIHWDGITPPRIIDDPIPGTAHAVGIDVRGEGGDRDILSTDSVSSTWTLTRVNLAGQVLSSTTSPVPEGCTNPGHGLFVTDPQTGRVYVVLSCGGVNAEGKSLLIKIALP